MVFYRFNSLSQGLKATSAGLFNVTVCKSGGAGGAKYVYKPILSAVPKTPSALSVATSSSHSHSSFSFDPHYVPKGWENYKDWKTWKDVPDSLIPMNSKRDPENAIYSNQTYINLRKKQIFFRRPVDLPVYLLAGQSDVYKMWFMWSATILTVLYISYEHYKEIYKKYYPESNLFYFF